MEFGSSMIKKLKIIDIFLINIIDKLNKAGASPAPAFIKLKRRQRLQK
jgi:hypothetical protein